MLVCFWLFNSVDCFVSYGVVFGYALGSFGLVCGLVIDVCVGGIVVWL